jgi:group I intron endonuclease
MLVSSRMTKPTRWILYCHTHSDSGRRYIGVTRKSLAHRWRHHVYCAITRKEKTHFANAIRKYGRNSFTHEVLEVCASREVAEVAEVSWIEFFDSTDPKKGFNLTRGGFGPPRSKASSKFAIPDSIGPTSEYRETRILVKRSPTNTVRRAISDSLSSSLREVEGHVSCGTHGLVPFSECFRAKSKVGKTLYRCKHCILARSKAKTVRRRENMRDSHGHVWTRVNSRTWKCCDCGGEGTTDDGHPPRPPLNPNVWLHCNDVVVKTVHES